MLSDDSNRMKLLRIVAITVIATLATQVLSLAGQQQQIADAQLSIVHRILNDNSAGNNRGWNPNGSIKAFTIRDAAFNPSISTVVINTKQANFPVCSVDYWTPGTFEVNCSIAPSNGGILSYVIISIPTTTSGMGAARSIRSSTKRARPKTTGATTTTAAERGSWRTASYNRDNLRLVPQNDVAVKVNTTHNTHAFSLSSIFKVKSSQTTFVFFWEFVLNM